jgi:putative transposase
MYQARLASPACQVFSLRWRLRTGYHDAVAIEALQGAPHVPRKPRRLQWTEAACYHVINRGHNRETVFADDGDRAKFLELLGRYQKRFDLRLYHYCLMTNHFHLVVRVRAAGELSTVMAGLLRGYVHYFNRRSGFVGHLWQGRFKSPAIEAEIYLLSCGRYVERNPLVAGMVKVPWDWRWSSCRAYALGEPDPLLADNPYYLELAATPERRQQLWQEFLLGEDAKEKAIAAGDWLVGATDFRKQTVEARGRPQGRGRGRPAKASGAFSSKHNRPKIVT